MFHANNKHVSTPECFSSPVGNDCTAGSTQEKTFYKVIRILFDTIKTRLLNVCGLQLNSGQEQNELTRSSARTEPSRAAAPHRQHLEPLARWSCPVVEPVKRSAAARRWSKEWVVFVCVILFLCLRFALAEHECVNSTLELMLIVRRCNAGFSIYLVLQFILDANTVDRQLRGLCMLVYMWLVNVEDGSFCYRSVSWWRRGRM